MKDLLFYIFNIPAKFFLFILPDHLTWNSIISEIPLLCFVASYAFQLPVHYYLWGVGNMARNTETTNLGDFFPIIFISQDISFRIFSLACVVTRFSFLTWLVNPSIHSFSVSQFKSKEFLKSHYRCLLSWKRQIEGINLSHPGMSACVYQWEPDSMSR